MARRISIAAAAFLLAGSLLWGRCVSCRTLAAQEPVHDCCQKGSCHRDSGEQPAGKPCPHQAMALDQYTQADPVAPLATVAVVPVDAGPSLAPVAVASVAPAAPLLVHPPPDLYLLNSVLLI